MKKWICTVCGYVAEGEQAPAECPICHVGADKFQEQTGELKLADCHKLGIAKGVDEEVLKGLRANFEGECCEVGMYLAMARVADREGYPEVAEAYKRYAFEEADHASRFAELLGEVLWDCTKTNLEKRVAAEFGATQGKKDIAVLAKKLGNETDDAQLKVAYDAIHDTVHEMCKDEARHCKGFNGLLSRYFGK